VPVSGVAEVSGLAAACGPVKAVNGIIFRIGRGEIFGLPGRNRAVPVTSCLGCCRGPRGGTTLAVGCVARLG
jgi:ABC-type branched-subunit amino acid transport system ATPase component